MIEELSDDKPLSARLEVARSEPEGPVRAANIALLAALRMRTYEAAAALRAAEEHPDPRRLAIVSSLVALWAGDPMRALVAADRSRDHPDGRALAAEALRLAGRYEEAAAHIEGLEQNHPFARVVAAQLAVEDDPRRALAMLWAVDCGGVLGARVRRVRAAAWLAHDPADPTRARDELSASVWRLVRLGAPDELGRAYLGMARVEAVLDAEGGRAAQWLARAHPLLQRTGTKFDQEQLRRAFRRFGRRAIDRLVADDLEQCIEGARAQIAHAEDLSRVASELHVIGGDANRVGVELEETLGDLASRQEQLIGSLESVLVDKEKTGLLVDVVRAMFLLQDATELDRDLPQLAVQLGGGSATLAIVRGEGRFEVLSKVGANPPQLDSVRTAIEASLRDGVARVLGTAERAVGVVPIRAPQDRVLVLRTAGRTGRGDDAERLAVLASVASAAYERAQSAAALGEAAARDAATLESIKDGILTLDAAGRVRAINSAGAALLKLDREDVAGRRLSELPGLGALADATRRAVEDEPITLPHAEVLVRARPYAGGVVATLQELGKARQLAQKLVGSAARFTFDDLLGRDPAFLDAIADARRVAVTDVPVLITGESGSGKELLAQAIHNASPRAAQPFVGVNVAAIPRELLESELFGYERGAFTGARAGGHPGRFELAGGGTILLDEIGDMPLEMQAKMLRVLQERSVQRLGGTRPVAVHARVIATTHHDLEQAVDEGRFRLDLFYRLRVVHLRLSPLRERPGDIALLVEHHLARYAQRHGRAPLTVAPHVMRELEAHTWPGNVRELANLIEGVASLTPTDVTRITTTPNLLRRSGSLLPAAPSDPGPTEVEPLVEVERRAVTHALAACEGNVAQTAKALGIARGTLYKKMERYGLR